MARHMLSWMDDHVPTTVVETLLRQHESGEESVVAAFSRWDVILDADAERQDRLDAIQHRLSDLLEGDDEKTSRLMLDSFAATGIEIDAVAVAMLRQTGMDVAAMLDIATTPRNGRLAATAFTVTSGNARSSKVEMVVSGPRVDVWIPLARDVDWTNVGMMLIARRLPQAVMIAMPGMKLARVVSHPLLDSLDLTITEAKIPMGDKRVHLSTDYEPRALRGEGLTFEDTRPERNAVATERKSPPRATNTPSFWKTPGIDRP